MAHHSDSFAASFDRELPGVEHEHPTYGILTRTLIHSPVVKQIIPARIRSKDFNDVVFVGETYIELYLLGDDGKLGKVAIKSDFQADIRHVRVFSTGKGNAGHAGVLSDDFMAEDIKGLLPPQILALTLDSGHMGFLYAVTKEDEVEFKMSTRKIDSKGVHPMTLGKSLAVDPKSRCLAVTAYQDTFRMYALYDTEELERQLQAGMPLNPIKERTFNISGVILHMEFLYPAPNDPDHVILVLFIVDGKQKFRLMLFEWWASKPLTTAMKHGQHGLLLDSLNVSIPLHIIPLLVDTAFLIISEDCIHAVRASDIISGRFALSKIEYLHASPDGGRQSLVTSWARPLRTTSHTQTMDDLYLAMEDGDIYFVEVNSETPNLVELMNKAGHLDCAIGSAFAALDYGLEKNDLVIAGGEMSSGGIYLLKIEPSSPDSGKDVEQNLEKTVPNWSPVFDFDLINPSTQGHTQGRAVRDRMYACTGRGEHGAIAEIRWGVHGLIQYMADYMPGIRNIWVLPDYESARFFFLCSFPDRSTLCSLDHSGEWEDVSDCEFLDMNQTTLAAAIIVERSVQITPRAVNVNLLTEVNLNKNRAPSGDITMFDGDEDSGANGDTEGIKPMWSRKCGPGDLIVAAAIRDAYMVIAVRSGASVKMTWATILPEVDGEGNLFKQIGSHIELQDDPSFVSIIKIGGQLLAIVGTREATIQFYLIDSSNGLIPTLEQSMLQETESEPTMVQRDLFICESCVPIMSATSTQLLCGLRNGTLIMFNATILSGNLQLERKNEVQFGPIPVQVLPHAQREDLVLVLAGPELYRFEKTGNEVAVSQIVFEGVTVEPALVAVSYVCIDSPSSETYIVCATKDQIFLTEVGKPEKVCVRRLPVFETPRRLLYHKSLNILIVAISKTAPVESMGRADTGSQKRGSSASLCFLNPRTGELLGDSGIVDSGSCSLVFNKENEQIYGLCEWQVEAETKDGRKTWKYVAICTGSINANPQSMKGRIIIISVWQNSRGRIEVKRRHQIACDAPVYSVAPYGKQSIVFCSGTKLCIRRLNIEARNKRLEGIADFRLRSPAVQITVNEPYINCSCASDSLCIIKFEEGSVDEDGQPDKPSKLHAYYSDEIARNGFSHYSPLENLFIVSDKQYGIAGLWQPPNKRNTGSLTTLFDTEITSSISRLRGGSLRPPWYANKVRPGVILPEKDIIGSGVDGSIFHLTLLNIDALRLLRYIQGIYTAQTEIHRHHYLSSAVPLGNTRLRADVDGDTLLSVIKLGEKWLRETVEKEESESPVGRGGITFREMVENVLGPGEDVFAKALEYVISLLGGVVL